MEIAQVSFTRGEASPIAAARTDQAFYQNALGICLNFFVRAEGGVSNRPGLQYIGQCVSAPLGSYLVPFVYNNTQSYLVEVSSSPLAPNPGTMNVYNNGNLIESLGAPYNPGDLVNIRWAQSADVLNLAVATTPPYQLTRQTLTNFTLASPQLLNGPFQDINIDGTTTVYASGTQGVVTLTASAPIFKIGHVGSLFTIQEQFLASIQPWEANKLLVSDSSGVSPVGLYTRSDGKIYQCVNALVSGANTATGVFQPVHTSGTQEDGNGLTIPNLAAVVGVSWQFVSTNAGVCLITGYIDAYHVTGVVQSDKGVYSNFPPTVVGGAQSVKGPFTFSGNGTTKTFTGLTAITTGDPNQFYVLVGGVFADPTTYSVSLANTSITFNTAPPTGTSNIVINQVTGTLINDRVGGSTFMPGLCLSTYWAFGSFSTVQGWPATVVYFNDRLVFGGTQLQPQTAFTSIVSNYIDFGVSNPTVDSDGIVFTMNARRENPIVDLIPLNDLLVGTASTIWRVTHSASVGAITPSDISLLPQNFYGEQAVPSVQTGDTVIYAQWGGRKIRDLVYQFQYDKYVGTELTVFARQIFPYGTAVTRMAYAPEPYGLLFCVRSDGVLCVCAYLPEQQVTAWSRYTTAGFFEDVCVLPENGSFSVYVIVRRVINGQTVRYIERFKPREYVTTQDAFFVDSGLTYDGRNTLPITMTLTGGTTWLANDTGNLTASAGFGGVFAPTDVTNNNAIWLNDVNGNRLCRLQIMAYVNPTYVNVKFLDPVPVSVQGVADSNWTFARTNFTGLTNLPNTPVVIYADGATMPNQTVSLAGTVTLPNAGGVVHIGLPYTCQLQSMQFNIQGQPTIRNHTKEVDTVSVVVDQSAPFYVGPDFEHLVQVEMREFESYGQPITLHTGVVHANIPATVEDDYTVCVQLQDPVPLTILSWIASVTVGEPG